MIFFLNAYIPLGVPSVYGFGMENERRYYEEIYPEYYPEKVDLKAGQPEAQSIVLSEFSPQQETLEKLLKQTENVWGVGQVAGIAIYSATQYTPAKVGMQRQHGHDITRPKTTIDYIVQKNGETALKDNSQKPMARTVSDTFLGLHVGYFANAFLRWMYVITGLITYTVTKMILIFLGMFCLNLWMEKHYNQVLSSSFSPSKRIGFRCVCWLILALSLHTNILASNVAIGIASWFGMATLMTGLMIYILTYRPKWLVYFTLTMLMGLSVFYLFCVLI